MLDTTIDGVGVLRGDLTDECAAMVQSVLDALSAPAGAGDLRAQPQRFHDALQEAMRWLGFCIVMDNTKANLTEAQLKADMYARLRETYDAAESVHAQLLGHRPRPPRLDVAVTFKDDGYSESRGDHPPRVCEADCAIEASQVDVVLVRDIGELTRCFDSAAGRYATFMLR